ncbi:MAG: CHAD domain-containing protein [Planctomycetota bacterium]
MAAPNTQSQGELLGDYIAKHRRRFADNLSLAIDAGDVESIHDLRVASRRLTEPLKLLSRWTCRRKTRRILKSMRKTRDAFRRVRDLDVVLASIHEPQAAPPIGADDKAQLDEILSQARERAFIKARRVCQRINADEAADRIDDLVSQFTGSLTDEANADIETRVSNLVASWTQRLLEKDPRDPLTTDLHDTRLCAKRLRYSVELYRDIGSRQNDPRSTALASLQEILGHWNDQLVVASRITAVARRPDILATHAGWAAKLLEIATTRLRSADEDRPRIITVWQQCQSLLHSADAATDARHFESTPEFSIPRNPLS